jgi:hypothetical protein
VSDIFREVDEEVRREQLKKLWDQYGNYLIALALLIVAGIGGWRAYDWWETRKAAEAGAAFEQAIKLSGEGKHAEAEAALAKLAVQGTAGYRALARIREAAELASRDPQAGAKAYDALAADPTMGRVLQDLATLRAGMILADSGTYAEVLRRLEPLTAPDGTFRHTAREVLALAAWRANDTAAVQRWFQLVVTDPTTPLATRGRVEMLMALVNADGKG